MHRWNCNEKNTLLKKLLTKIMDVDYYEITLKIKHTKN